MTHQEITKSMEGYKETPDEVKTEIQQPILSILITAWNCWNELKPCLESIYRSDFKDIEIIVNDNASQDDTVRNLHKYFPDVKININSVNIGAAPAFNQSCKIVQGRYILLLDPDTEVPPDMISILVSFMTERPDVSLAAPRTYNTDGSIQESARNFPTFSSGLFGRQSILTRLFPSNPFSRRYLQRDKLEMKNAYPVQQISAACMIFPLSLINEVGPWDEGYPKGRDDWVDTDWCIRLKKKGKKIYCVPETYLIHHDNNLIGKKKSNYRIWAFHWGAYRLYRIHSTFGVLDPRSIIALIVLCARAGLLMTGNYFLPDPKKGSQPMRTKT